MKWNGGSISQYLESREYIDTAVIPLAPLIASDEASVLENASQHEALHILSNELEKELAGRIMLFPAYLYLKAHDHNAELERLEAWISEIQNLPFKHLFLLTFDMSWKRSERELPGELIWIPHMPLDDMKSKEFFHAVKNQSSQIRQLMQTYWE